MSKGDETRLAILTHAARLSGRYGLDALSTALTQRYP